MKRSVLLAAMLLAVPVLGQSQADHVWLLDQSSLTYHMSHPLHEVDGTSHAAKGKGVCHAGVCDFLLAAPVKTFDSGDSNRDLHMLQVTRGAEFPVVVVRFRIPESAVNLPTLDCDLEVQFAGNTAHYAHVTFHQQIDGNAMRRTEGNFVNTAVVDGEQGANPVRRLETEVHPGDQPGEGVDHQV